MLIILGTAIFNSKTSISLNRTRHIGVCPADTALQTPEHILQQCLLCIQLKEKFGCMLQLQLFRDEMGGKNVHFVT